MPVTHTVLRCCRVPKLSVAIKNERIQVNRTKEARTATENMASLTKYHGR